MIYESPAVKVPVLDGAIKVNALLATGDDLELITAKQVFLKSRRSCGLGDSWSASASFESPLWLPGIGYDKAIPSSFTSRGFLNATDKAVAGGSGICGGKYATCDWSSESSSRFGVKGVIPNLRSGRSFRAMPLLQPILTMHKVG